MRDCERFGFVGGDAVGRLRNVQLAQHRGEELAVFGDLDALRRGADDVDAVLLQAEREVQRRLPAELRDGAPAFLPLVNVQHVFQRERLEEELVARVVIGGNGFRVRVHHERLEAVLLERERRVDAAVIELDALADAVRPAAEDHHLLLVARTHLVIAAVVGRIIIRRVGLELGGAGIHEPIARHEAELLALGADVVFGLAGQMGDLPVGETERLGFGQLFSVHAFARG